MESPSPDALNQAAPLPHKLAAILYADVEGYSRLTGADEAGTHRTLSAYLDLFAETIKAHRGEVKHYAGDAVLADFSTVSDALNCAVEFQKASKEKNETVPEDKRIKFRIGLNLGEVIVDRGEVYGNGVNVAARLETLAEPGGICISGATHDAIGNKLPFDYEYLGEHTVKNIDKPVRAYRVNFTGQPSTVKQALPVAPSKKRSRMLIGAIALLAATAIGVWQLSAKRPSATAQAIDPVLAMPTGPAIAVLPFTNMSGDASQEYFSDGLTEDIITALSQFRDLFVIARNSTFEFKGKPVDVREVGAKLGAHYVLEGSVRREQSRVRINAQLLDAKTGAHLWAETFDRDLTTKDIFAVQDEITSKVVAKIGDPLRGTIAQNKKEQLSVKSDIHVEAYACVLRGKVYFDSFDPTLHKAARECLERTVETHPKYADAWAWLALTFADEHVFGFDPRPNSLARAVTAAQTAVRLDSANQMGHWFLARSLFFQRNFDQFKIEAERAVALNPNNTAAIAGAAIYTSYAGDWERGKVLSDRALALNPNPPWWYYVVPFYYYYLKGDYEQALSYATKSHAAAPNFYWTNMALAAVHGQLGHTSEAGATVAEVLRLYPDYPAQARNEMAKFNVSAELTAKMFDGLRKAGMKIPDAGT